MPTVSMLVNPPGPRTLQPMGYLRAFRHDPLATMLHLARTYGDFVRFRMAGDYLYLVSDPQAIKDILVTDNDNFVKGRALQFLKRVLGDGLLTSEGDFHLRQRRLVQPAFHRQRMAAYADVMAGYAARLAADWAELAAGGQTEIDMAQEMTRLTLAIVGKTLFDADVAGEAGEIGPAVSTALLLFERFSNPLTPLLERLPLPSNRRFARAMARLDATVLQMISQRRATGEDRGDLLSMLLMAQDEDARTGQPAGMSDRQVRDEAMTLFLAGHETTANLLTWTWCLLSQNPPAEAMLHAELDSELGGRPPGFADLPRLPYLRMVLAESMRLLPPAYVLGRQAMEDYRVGPYTIPAGSGVLISQYVVQRDPRWYPDAECFEPERWTPEAQAARPKFSYFPFGGGPRVCIGEQFAWTEGALILATLAQRWRPRLMPGQRLAMRPLITLRPAHGVRMQLAARS